MESKKVLRKITIDSKQEKVYPSNSIKTAKYNILTFLPLALINQFTNYFNIFFLLTAVILSIPQISPIDPASAVSPFLVVLFISLIREGIEDYKKAKFDKTYNNSSSLQYNKEKSDFEQIKWKDISLGRIIKVCKNEVMPADVLIVKSSLDNGFCYLQTTNLDGESALKPREAMILFQDLVLSQSDLAKTSQGVIEVDQPDNNIYRVEGSVLLNLNDEKKYFDINNILLRGGTLKNVEFIYGIVIYTGKDTKIMKNIQSGSVKLSSIDIQLNKIVIYLIVFCFLICIICTVFGMLFWNDNKPDYANNKLGMDHIFHHAINTDYPEMNEMFKIFAAFFTMFNTLIPISVMITMEVVKGMQIVRMEKEMRKDCPNEKSKILSMKLHEDLGNVRYIFTDKTGTLTRNEMEFKACSIFTRLYDEEKDQICDADSNSSFSKRKSQSDNEGTVGVGEKNDNNLKNNSPNNNKANNKENVPLPLPLPPKSIFSDKFETKFLKASLLLDHPIDVCDLGDTPFLSMKDAALEFFLNIAINHNVLTETDSKTGEKSYTGSNPDEIVLVQAAKELGIEFIERSNKFIKIKVFDQEFTFTILYRFEYSSARMRSSIIIKDNFGVIKLYMKGADSIILKKIDEYSQNFVYQTTKEHLDKFAKSGLRTLCFSLKIIEEDVFRDWEIGYKQMQEKAINDKSLAKDVEDTIAKLEDEMLLSGVTGLEDKLQEDVKMVLQDFIEAGVNVWMLTGDKLDTAESIGYSCKLFNDDTEVFKIKASNDKYETRERIKNILQKMEILETELINFKIDKKRKKRRGEGRKNKKNEKNEKNIILPENLLLDRNFNNTKNNLNFNKYDKLDNDNFDNNNNNNNNNNQSDDILSKGIGKLHEGNGNKRNTTNFFANNLAYNTGNNVADNINNKSNRATNSFCITKNNFYTNNSSNNHNLVFQRTNTPDMIKSPPNQPIQAKRKLMHMNSTANKFRPSTGQVFTSKGQEINIDQMNTQIKNEGMKFIGSNIDKKSNLITLNFVRPSLENGNVNFNIPSPRQKRPASSNLMAIKRRNAPNSQNNIQGNAQNNIQNNTQCNNANNNNGTPNNIIYPTVNNATTLLKPTHNIPSTHPHNKEQNSNTNINNNNNFSKSDLNEDSYYDDEDDVAIIRFMVDKNFFEENMNINMNIGVLQENKNLVNMNLMNRTFLNNIMGTNTNNNNNNNFNKNGFNNANVSNVNSNNHSISNNQNYPPYNKNSQKVLNRNTNNNNNNNGNIILVHNFNQNFKNNHNNPNNNININSNEDYDYNNFNLDDNNTNGNRNGIMNPHIVNEEDKIKLTSTQRNNFKNIKSPQNNNINNNLYNNYNGNINTVNTNENFDFNNLYEDYKMKIKRLEPQNNTLFSFNFNNEEDDKRDKDITMKNFGLIIEGISISQCLDEEIAPIFWECLKKSRSIICCRCAPIQKSDVVTFVKKQSGEVTLAIGDGGNDVNMIKSANVGVGIFGKEGYQAAFNSDYAISQFKHLRKLLFTHGRFSLLRNSYFVNFFFYKNLIYTFPQFWYSLFNGFSGGLLWDDFFYLGYNSFFTTIPASVRMLCEEDIDITFEGYPDRKITEYLVPDIYKEYRYTRPFNIPKFFLIFIGGLIHSVVMYFLPMFIYKYGVMDNTGRNVTLWNQSLSSFLAIMIVQYYIIFEDSFYYNPLSIFAHSVQMIVYTAFFFGHEVRNYDQLSGTTFDIVANFNFWLILTLTIFVSILPLIAMRRMEIHFSDSIINNLRHKKYEHDFAKKTYMKKLSEMQKYTRSLAKFKKIYNLNEDYEPDNLADKKIKDMVDTYKSTKNKSNAASNSNLAAMNLGKNKKLIQNEEPDLTGLMPLKIMGKKNNGKFNKPPQMNINIINNNNNIISAGADNNLMSPHNFNILNNRLSSDPHNNLNNIRNNNNNNLDDNFQLSTEDNKIHFNNNINHFNGHSNSNSNSNNCDKKEQLKEREGDGNNNNNNNNNNNSIFSEEIINTNNTNTNLHINRRNSFLSKLKGKISLESEDKLPLESITEKSNLHLTNITETFPDNSKFLSNIKEETAKILDDSELKKDCEFLNNTNYEIMTNAKPASAVIKKQQQPIVHDYPVEISNMFDNETENEESRINISNYNKVTLGNVKNETDYVRKGK